MATSTTQSFIVSGPIMSFECDIDLTAADAEERIDELAGDLRRVVQRMRRRTTPTAAVQPGERERDR
jgi:hypothetical protein